jgi:predicted ATPase
MRSWTRNLRRDVVVTGEPGSGKTTLWEAGLAVARERGSVVAVGNTAAATTFTSRNEATCKSEALLLYILKR